jgi:hypothetical protein
MYLSFSTASGFSFREPDCPAAMTSMAGLICTDSWDWATPKDIDEKTITIKKTYIFENRNFLIMALFLIRLNRTNISTSHLIQAVFLKHPHQYSFITKNIV